MPNWCQNYIRITGDADSIKRITQLIKMSDDENGAGVFTTLVGLPEGMTPAEYSEGWWDANISHWGTKWDIAYVKENYNFSFYDESITISEETAWSPPIPFCQKVATIFGVEVHITYEEPGMGFAGETFCYPDGTIDDREYEYGEGLYITNNEYSWDSFLESELSYINEEEGENEEFNIETWVSEHLHYCTKDEIKTIVEQYNVEYAN